MAHPLADRDELNLRTSAVRLSDSSGELIGSGFVVAPGLVATAAHNLAPQDKPELKRVTVNFAAGSATIDAEVDEQLWQARGPLDVAFLRLESAMPEGVHVAELAERYRPQTTEVVAYGFSAGGLPKGHYGYGKVGGNGVTSEAGAGLLQLRDSGEVTTGFSGGPVADTESGLIIGMVVLIMVPDAALRGLGTTFILPVEQLHSLCAEIAVAAECPYRGLEPFEAHDADVYFGRQDAVDSVIHKLLGLPNWVLLTGASGSGKSSLMQAGVLPALQQQQETRTWKSITIRALDNPYAQLENAGLAAARDNLSRAAAAWLADHDDCSRLLLVIDQFEELLLQTEPAFRGFLGDLVRLANTQLPITVLMVLRDDMFHALSRNAGLPMDQIVDQIVSIPATLSRAQVLEIIEKPAAHAGLQLSHELAERIATDAIQASAAADDGSGTAEPTILPLLEFALTELWRRRQDGRLTSTAYNAMKGVDGSLAVRCESVYAALNNAEKQLARVVLTALVRPAEPDRSLPATGRRQNLRELRAQASEPDDVDVLVNKLATRRLLITSRSAGSDEPSVQLAHDALFRAWRRLRQWAGSDPDLRYFRDRISRTALLWVDAQESASTLLSEPMLSEAVNWLESRPEEFNPDVRRFVQASSGEHVRRSRSHRRSRALVAVLAVATVIVLISTAVQTWRVTAANDQLSHASMDLQAKRLAATATNLANKEPELAKLLAIRSLQVATTQEGYASLQATLRAPAYRHKVFPLGATGLASVAVSPDGRILATGDSQGTVRVWDIATGKGIGQPIRAHNDAIRSMTFSHDGKLLASAGNSTSVKLWDTGTWQQNGSQLLAESAVVSLAFSHDDRLLLSAGDGGEVIFWQTATGTATASPLRPDGSGVMALAVTEDGSTLATGTIDGNIYLWNMDTRQQTVVPLHGHKDSVWALAFSHDGQTLVSGSIDKTVRTWKWRQPNPAALTLEGHSDIVYAVAVNANGVIASADDDGVIRLWKGVDGTEIGPPILGHDAAVDSLAFTPDGNSLATASEDGSARVWETTPRQPLGAVLVGAGDEVSHLAYDQTGKRLLSQSVDGTLIVWDTATNQQLVHLHGQHGVISADGTKLAAADGQSITLWTLTGTTVSSRVLSGHHKPVTALSFSGDGHELVSGAEDGTALVWDSSTGSLATDPLTGHSESVLFVAVNTDATRIVTASLDHDVILWHRRGDKTAIVDQHTLPESPRALVLSPDGKRVAVAAGSIARTWDISGPQPPLQRYDLTGHGDAVTALAFSADSQLLATGSADSTTRLWTAADGRSSGTPLTAHARGVTAVAFANDAQAMATVSNDGTVALWNPGTREMFGFRLSGHDGDVYQVVFSPDSGQLATAGDDGTVRLWAAPRWWTALACDLAGRNLTQTEWDRYVGASASYTIQCPQFPVGAGVTAGSR